MGTDTTCLKTYLWSRWYDEPSRCEKESQGVVLPSRREVFVTGRGLAWELPKEGKNGVKGGGDGGCA